jgi:hypothetical protein
MRPDKLVNASRLRAEFLYLLTHDETDPDWSRHELAMILRRFDKAIQNTCHHRDHHRPPADA